MNNLLELIKVNLRQTLDFRKFKEERGKMISFMAVLLGTCIFGVLISCVYSYILGQSFIELNIPLYYNVVFMASLCSILIFSTSVLSLKGIFIGQDYELLHSMPISKATIIASKLVSLYILSVFISGIVLLPNGIITSMFTSDISYTLFSFIWIFCIPAVPLLFSTILSLFITLIADRFRFGNIISIILYAGILAAVLLFSFVSSSSASNLQSMVSAISWFNPTVFWIRMTYVSSYAYSFFFIGCNLLVLAFVVFLITLLFNPVYTAIHSYRSNTKYTRKTLEAKGQFKTLFGVEAKRYFTSKLYFMNTFVSGILAIIVSISLATGLDSIKSTIGTAIEEYAYMGYIVIIFMIGIATPASCAMNIEGKTFWIVKSYPIDPKTSIRAKLAVSTLVLGVCSGIASIILIVSLKPDIFSSILLFVLPVLYVILVSEIGLLLNLYFYNLTWKNEQEAVKKSINGFFGVIIDILLSVVLLALSIGLALWNAYASGIITLLVLVLASIAIYMVLMHIAESRYEQIEL